MSAVKRAASALQTVFRSRGLRQAELAWGASVSGDFAHFVALGVFAYETGGARAVGLAGLIRMLPAGVIAPLAASLGDRFRRERFLIAVYGVGAVAAAGSVVAFYHGHSEAVVFALAALVGLTATLARPTHHALLPSLSLTPQELLAANGATSTIESLATLAGPLFAGFAVALTSPGVAFAGSAIAFALAAALVARIHAEGWVPAPAGASGRRAVLAGLTGVARRPRARLVIALMVVQSFVRGCLNVLIVVAAFRVLDHNEGAVGYLTAAIGFGGLLGSFAVLALEGRKLAAAFGVALVLWGVPIALVAPVDLLPIAMVLLGIVGFANSIEDVTGFTLLQRLVPDELLARVLGLLMGAAMGAVGLGSIAATGLVAALGTRPAFLLVGAILPAVTVLSWHSLGEIDHAVAAPRDELGLLTAVPMFALLSLGARERLAERLSAIRIRAGEVLMRAGDTGDRFYIVRSGELEIAGEGFRSAAEPGDYVGEIALLRDVPRTATVRAAADSELYALTREDFLAVVAAHAGVRAAGDVVAEERLAAPARTAPPA